MTFDVILAARTGSKRLPGKALLPFFGDLSMIIFLIRRIAGSKNVNKIIFATTTLPADDRLASIVASEGVTVFRGDENDVVKRYVDASKKFNSEYIVRITGDCPFTDAETLDYCLEQCGKFGKFDIASTKSFFPVGIDYEIFDANLLAKIYIEGDLSDVDREHLTKYFYDNPDDFDIRTIEPLDKWKSEKGVFTIDTLEDYNTGKDLAGRFDDIYFGVDELIQLVKK